jgi:hypothetical protein
MQISPKGRALNKESRQKENFNLPPILINAELYGLVLAPRLKNRIPSNLGIQFLQPKNGSELAPSFFGPDS